MQDKMQTVCVRQVSGIHMPPIVQNIYNINGDDLDKERKYPVTEQTTCPLKQTCTDDDMYEAMRKCWSAHTNVKYPDKLFAAYAHAREQQHHKRKHSQI